MKVRDAPLHILHELVRTLSMKVRVISSRKVRRRCGLWWRGIHSGRSGTICSAADAASIPGSNAYAMSASSARDALRQTADRTADDSYFLSLRRSLRLCRAVGLNADGFSHCFDGHRDLHAFNAC